MTLSVDVRKIATARVVIWDTDEDLYGVDYETLDGSTGSDLIGTRAEAEAIVRQIAAHPAGSFDKVIRLRTTPTRRRPF